MVIMYWLPSPLSPTVWLEPNALPRLEGALAVNNRLTNADIVDPDLFHGPECIEFDDKGQFAYVSIGDGTVAKFNSSTGAIIGSIFFTGGYLLSPKKQRTNGLKIKSAVVSELFDMCNEQSMSKELQWNTDMERACGRPLGLRYLRINGVEHLYILDAYHGLFLLDLSMNKARHLVKPGDTIIQPSASVFASNDPAASLPPQFFNDLDLGPDSTVIFTDSSYKFTRSENRQEVLDGAPRGRLFSFTPARISNNHTADLRVLLCGLHFPNGVQFMKKYNSTSNKFESTEELLVAELARFRVLKVNVSAVAMTGKYTPVVKNHFGVSDDHNVHTTFVSGTSCGESGSVLDYSLKATLPGGIQYGDKRTHRNRHPHAEANYAQLGVQIFTDSLPGLADNIRADCPSLTTTFTHIQQEEIELYEGDGDGGEGGNEKEARDNSCKYLVGFGSKSAHPFSLLWMGYQLTTLRTIIGKLVPMKWVEHLVPKYGLVAVLSDSGEIVDSLHDPTGRISLISHAARNPWTGDIWLGSHSNHYMGVLRAARQSNNGESAHSEL